MQHEIFKEIRVGGSSKAELLRQLEAQSVSLNDYAKTLFDDPRFTTSSEPHNVSLVVVSLLELGLPDGATYAEIVTRAQNTGLRSCSLETAPHLRLQYPDQPVGTYLTVASEILRADDLCPNGLYLRRLQDGLWLRGYNAGPDHVYPPGFTRFSFALG